MRFSVILPVYNVEKYLRTCVNSILSQEYNDYELILVDDGSTDSSSVLCDDLAKSNDRITVIHKKNGGLSDARNCGVLRAQGDYIVFIDSDDFLLRSDFLCNLSDKTITYPDLILYKYQKYYDSTKSLEDCGFSYESAEREVIYARIIGALVRDDAYYGMAWIKAVRREIITNNNIQFEVGLLGEDMDWNYQVILNSKSIKLLDMPYIAYRQREGSITSTQKLKNLCDFIYILEKWSKIIMTECKDEELKTALYGSLAKYYTNLLIVYSRLSDLNKKKYVQQIKALNWLLNYSMSHRPKMIAKVYKTVGFAATIKLLKIADKVK